MGDSRWTLIIRTALKITEASSIPGEPAERATAEGQSATVPFTQEGNRLVKVWRIGGDQW